MTGLRIHLVPLALLLLALTWIESRPNGDEGFLRFALVAVLGGLAIAWLILAMVNLWRPSGSRLWTLAAPLLVAAVIGPQFIVSPLEARWHFAQPSFDSALAEVRAGPDRDIRSADSFDRNIGSYQVRKAWKAGTNTYFAVDGAFLADGAGGFVHRPRGAAVEAAGCNSQSDERLTDEWFTFECQS